MKSQVLTAMTAASLALSTAFSPAQQAGVQGTAEREIRRQETMADYAQKAVNKGTEAMLNQDYESAFAYFKSAVDVLPSGGPATQSIRETALDGFCRAAVKLAEQRISEGRYQDATTTVTVVLEERYAPNYGPALALERKLKDPTRFNRALTPGFIANVEEVKQLLLEADGFYASGRFDLAFKRYEQVLNIDKYNIAARRGMERVNGARQRYAENAYNEARGDMLRQVDKGWELPVRRFEVGASTIIEQPQIDTRGTSLINRKLDEIVIPRIDFRDATIREALDFIKQRTVALDTTEQDPSRKGINIVLKAAADSPEANARITLSLNDIPLRAAIDYVAKAANLKLKIEPYAVAVVPQSEPTDILITKEYKVPPGFITSLPAAQPPAAGPRRPAHRSRIATRHSSPLGREGVLGSSRRHVPSRRQRKLHREHKQADRQKYTGESRSDRHAGGNANDGSPQPGGDRVKVPRGDTDQPQGNGLRLVAWPICIAVWHRHLWQRWNSGASDKTSPQFLRFPIHVGRRPYWLESAHGGQSFGHHRHHRERGRRLAFRHQLPRVPHPPFFPSPGSLPIPNFKSFSVHLNQQKGVDLVSAPKVTTKSGQRATIQIVREFRYPTEYDLPQVTQTPGSIFTPATPTTPTSFETKPVGITLEVEPTVGPDGYTIDLILSPRVVEFDGFINYGSPISTVVTTVAPWRS